MGNLCDYFFFTAIFSLIPFDNNIYRNLDYIVGSFLILSLLCCIYLTIVLIDNENIKQKENRKNSKEDYLLKQDLEGLENYDEDERKNSSS